MNEITRTRARWQIVWSVAALIILTEIPIIQRTMGGALAILPFICLFYVAQLGKKIAIRDENLLFSVCLVLYFAMAILYKLVGISSAGYGHDIHTILYITYFFSISTVLRMNGKQKGVILKLLFVSIFITMIGNTITFYRLGEYAYFRLHHIEEDANLGNIVNTHYSTALMLMGGVLFICILHERRTRMRFLWIMLFSICVLFNVAICQRMINILLTAGMCVLIYINNKRIAVYRSFLLILGTVVLCVLVYNHENIINALAQVIDSPRLLQRLRQITSYLSSGDIQEAGGSLTVRFNLYAISINTWLESAKAFLFGVGDHISDNTVIGNHSQFLDCFAQYGVIGGGCFIFMVYKTMNILVRKLNLDKNGNLYKQIGVIFFVLTVRGIIGSVINAETGIVMFVFLPIVISRIKEEEQLQ